MPRPVKPDTDHEYERLNPGTHSDPPQADNKGQVPRGKNDAALPGSQNADLRGAKRERKPRGAST